MAKETEINIGLKLHDLWEWEKESNSINFPDKDAKDLRYYLKTLDQAANQLENETCRESQYRLLLGIITRQQKLLSILARNEYAYQEGYFTPKLKYRLDDLEYNVRNFTENIEALQQKESE